MKRGRFSTGCGTEVVYEFHIYTHGEVKKNGLPFILKCFIDWMNSCSSVLQFRARLCHRIPREALTAELTIFVWLIVVEILINTSHLTAKLNKTIHEQHY
jgi:hypothetical protein